MFAYCIFGFEWGQREIDLHQHPKPQFSGRVLEVSLFNKLCCLQNENKFYTCIQHGEHIDKDDVGSYCFTSICIDNSFHLLKSLVCSLEWNLLLLSLIKTENDALETGTDKVGSACKSTTAPSRCVHIVLW